MREDKFHEGLLSVEPSEILRLGKAHLWDGGTHKLSE